MEAKPCPFSLAWFLTVSEYDKLKTRCTQGKPWPREAERIGHPLPQVPRALLWQCSQKGPDQALKWFYVPNGLSLPIRKMNSKVKKMEWSEFCFPEKTSVKNESGQLKDSNGNTFQWVTGKVGTPLRSSRQLSSSSHSESSKQDCSRSRPLPPQSSLPAGLKRTN